MNRIKLTESQLHQVIKESVKKILKESNPIKLQKSFKSKEDMTDYRDMYSPNSENSGPFEPYSNTVCDDGYDYCGDDIGNEDKFEYNHGLSKRLATKGGQMSYDWEHSLPTKKNIEWQHHIMNRDYNGRQNRENELNKRREKISNRQRNNYVNGRKFDDIEDIWNDSKDSYNK